MDRCSERGIIRSAAKLIDTGNAERKIVQPAFRADSSAAAAVVIPEERASRNRLTIRRA